ncbi:MAG: biotin/lipoyl-binding protein [Planctomycetales bacterium]
MRWIVLTTSLLLCAGGLFLLREDLLKLISTTADEKHLASGGPEQTPPRIFAAGIVEGLDAPLDARFEIPGKVIAVHVKANDRVKAGQLLAELDPEPYRLRVAQAEAQLRIARTERNRVNTGRGASGPIRQSRRNGQTAGISQVADESAALTEDQVIAEARVDAAEAALKLEQLQLEKTRLLAPQNGIIMTATLKAGTQAGPSPESGEISLVDRTKTRVRAFVEELDAMDVQSGRRVTVTVSGRSDREYPGRIVSCAPTVQPKSHRHLNPGERLDVRVREIVVELDGGEELLIGLPVEVYIHGEKVLPKNERASAKSPAKVKKKSHPQPAGDES